MCSICGEIDFSKPSKGRLDIVRKMNYVQKHRGPDDSDIYTDQFACLGHNRLSVIDIENGHQPMSVIYGNKKYTIVYNGEIYNCDELRKEIKKHGIGGIFPTLVTDTVENIKNGSGYFRFYSFNYNI